MEGPRWGNAISRTIARGLIRLMGWRLDVQIPDVPKLVLIGAPHTSNWDGIIGVTAIVALGLRINWFAKDTLFRWPFGGVLRWLGGVPIIRNKARGIVEQTADVFRSRDKMYIVLAPEGTRSRAPVWKTGFHRIARAAEAPILPAYMDYKKKVIGTGPVLYASDDYAADLRTLQTFYRDIAPRHPERFAAEG